MHTIPSIVEKKQDKQRNIRIFCIVLLALMIFSTAGYAFFSNPNAGISGQQSDNGLRQYGDKWLIGSDDKPIIISFSPEDVSNTTVYDVATLNNYVSEPLFIDSTDSLATSEIAGAFQYYSSRIQEGCYLQCERDIPEKNCTENMIIFKDSDLNIVRQQDRCVFIEGNIGTIDAYLYRLFGISNS